MSSTSTHLFDHFAIVGIGEDAKRQPLQSSPFPNYPEVTAEDRATHWDQVSKEIVDVQLVSPGQGEWIPPGYTMITHTPSGDSANLNTGMMQTNTVYLCIKRTCSPSSTSPDKEDDQVSPIVDLQIVTGRQGVSPVDAESVSQNGEYTVLWKTIGGHNGNLCKSSFTLRQAYLRFRRFDPLRNHDFDSRSRQVITDIAVINASKGEEVPPGYTALEADANKSSWHGSSRMRICLQKSPTILPGMLDVPFSPTLLDYAPKAPTDREALPPSIESFCAPMGLKAVWCNVNQPPPPLISHFVLTDTHRDFSFGSSLVIYEPISNRISEKIVRDHRIFRKNLLNDESDGHESTAKVNGNTLHSRGGSRTSPPNEGSMIHSPKCICLISREPFFNSAKECLIQLLRIALSRSTTPGRREVLLPPVEYFVGHLLHSIPRPLSQVGTLHVKLGTKRVEFSNDVSTNLPCGQVDLGMVLQEVAPQTLISLFRLMLLEQKVLLLSKSANLLVQTAELTRGLIYPFSWQSVYIPVCPERYLGVLDAPMTFLVGTQVSLRCDTPCSPERVNSDRLSPNSVMFPTVPDDVWVLDIDRDEVVTPRQGANLASLPPQVDLILQIGLAQVRECIGVSNLQKRERNSFKFGGDFLNTATMKVASSTKSALRLPKASTSVNKVGKEPSKTENPDLVFKAPSWRPDSKLPDSNSGSLRKGPLSSLRKRHIKRKQEDESRRTETLIDDQNVEKAFEIFRDTGVRAFSVLLGEYYYHLTPPNPVHAHWIQENQEHIRNSFANGSRARSISKAGLGTIRLQSAPKEVENKFLSPYDVNCLFDRERFLEDAKERDVNGLVEFLSKFVETQMMHQFLQNRTYSVFKGTSPVYQYFDTALDICAMEDDDMDTIASIMDRWFECCEWISPSTRQRSSSIRGDVSSQYLYVDVDEAANSLLRRDQSCAGLDKGDIDGDSILDNNNESILKTLQTFPLLQPELIEKVQRETKSRLEEASGEFDCGPLCRSWAKHLAAYQALATAGIRSGPEGVSDEQQIQNAYAHREQNKSWATLNLQCVLGLWLTLSPYAVSRDLITFDTAYDVFQQYEKICHGEAGDQCAVRSMLAVCAFELCKVSRDQETWVALKAQRVYEKLISWSLCPSPLSYGVFTSMVGIMEKKLEGAFPLVRPNGSPVRRRTVDVPRVQIGAQKPALLRASSTMFATRGMEQTPAPPPKPPSPTVQQAGFENQRNGRLTRSGSTTDTRLLQSTLEPSKPVPLHQMGKKAFVEVLSKGQPTVAEDMGSHPWLSDSRLGTKGEPACVILWTITKCHECGAVISEDDVMGGWGLSSSDSSIRCVGCGRGVVPQLRAACIWEAAAEPLSPTQGIFATDFKAVCGTPMTARIWEREMMCPIVVRKLLERFMGAKFSGNGAERKGLEKMVFENPSLYWNLVFHFARQGLSLGCLHHDWQSNKGRATLEGSQVWAVWDGMKAIRFKFPELYQKLRQEKQFPESHPMNGLHGKAQVAKYLRSLDSEVMQRWVEVQNLLLFGEVRRAIEVYLQTRSAHTNDDAWSSFATCMYSAFYALYSTHQNDTGGYQASSKTHSTLLEQRLTSTIGWVGKDLSDELHPSDYPPKRRSLYFRQVFGSPWC